MLLGFITTRPVRLDADVIRHRAVLRAKNFVAWFEVRDIFPNRFDDPGEIGSEASILRFAHSAHWPHQPSCP